MSLSVSDKSWAVIKSLVPLDETLLMTVNRLARGDYSIDPWWEMTRHRYQKGRERSNNKELIDRAVEREMLERQENVKAAVQELQSNIAEELKLTDIAKFEKVTANLDGCAFCADPKAERYARTLLANWRFGDFGDIFHWSYYPPSIAFNAKLCDRCYSTSPGNLEALPEIKMPDREPYNTWLINEQTKKETNAVLELLKSKEFCRALPYTDGSVLDTVGRYVVGHKPVKTVMLWGAGRKKHANWAEEEAFAMLHTLDEKAKEVYEPGLEIRILNTDTHGVFNWAEPEEVLSYQADILKLAKDNSFAFSRLARLIWLKYGICGDEILRACKSHSEISEKGPGWFNYVPNKDIYVEQAKKHHRPYGVEIKDDLDAKNYVKQYYMMRHLEKKPLELEFNDHLFLTFSDPRTRDTLPELPTAYLWSLKRGTSEPPWFIDDTREQYVARRRSAGR